MSKGYVYFISDNDGSMKVGVTENIDKRMKALQTGNAKPLELMYYVQTKDMKEAYELEAALHRKLKRHKIINEWFKEKAVLRLIRRRTVRVDGFKFRGMGCGILDNRITREITLAILVAIIVFLSWRLGTI